MSSTTFDTDSRAERKSEIGMVDREKVIKGLEACLPPHDPDCNLCPYDSIDLRCRAKLRDDVMALLKAQEPRVMTLEELIGIYNFRENHSWVYDTPPYLYLDNRAWIGYWVSWSDIVGCLEGQEAGYKVEKYGERWRCWTSRPTDAQREAIPWG